MVSGVFVPDCVVGAVCDRQLRGFRLCVRREQFSLARFPGSLGPVSLVKAVRFGVDSMCRSLFTISRFPCNLFLAAQTV